MYTIKILYIPLFIALVLLFISIIIGISLYSSKNKNYKENTSIQNIKERILNECNCCCQCCCCNCSSSSNSTDNNTNDNPGGSSGGEIDDNPGGSSGGETDDNPGGSSRNKTDNNPGGSSRNKTDDNPGGSSGNKTDNNPGGSSGRGDNSYDNGSENNNINGNPQNYETNISKLHDHEINISISIFVFSSFFYFEFFCFLMKYGCEFQLNCCFFFQFFITLGPLLISFILNLVLLIIRIKCQNIYLTLFGIDLFIKLNRFLIFLNIFQMFLIIVIILLFTLIFFIKIERLNEICFCSSCDCSQIKYFFGSICEKKNQSRHNSNSSEIEDINNIINPELPQVKKLNYDINPEGSNCEIYKSNILLGQKILIVMTYEEPSINIKALFHNGSNKTVNDAVIHYGIKLIAVNNYEDAIKELTKNENGYCPYYACWLLNDYQKKNKMEEFIDILIKFWKNGGAVVLFSDNEPLILETNLFLSKINANFIMDGSYIGEKYIVGDDTGLLNKPGLFNRSKDVYKYNDIKRQTLSHNLYTIYEGVTISSTTKNLKRGMDINKEDIAPFIPFARDSEGGFTSLLKLANDSGEGDLIIDGGYTKLFINMKEKGTFRYIQNIAGFTARPEVHISNNIIPKDYRPKRVIK